MSEQQTEAGEATESRPGENAKTGVPGEDARKPPASPFDHPYFLPVLLFLFAAWFGYDGWLNDDPDMQEHLAFNRNGFVVALVAACYFTIQTKFDVPFLLSGLYAAGAIWVGWAGTDASIEPPFTFLYQGTAGAMALAALYFGVQELRRRRAREGATP